MVSDTKIKGKYTKEYNVARRKFKLTLKALSRMGRTKRLFTAAFSDRDAILRIMMERGARRAWTVHELNRHAAFKDFSVGNLLKLMLKVKVGGWVTEVK